MFRALLISLSLIMPFGVIADTETPKSPTAVNQESPLLELVDITLEDIERHQKAIESGSYRESVVMQYHETETAQLTRVYSFVSALLIVSGAFITIYIISALWSYVFPYLFLLLLLVCAHNARMLPESLSYEIDRLASNIDTHIEQSYGLIDPTKPLTELLAKANDYLEK